MTQFVAKPVEGRFVKSPDHSGAFLPPEGLPVTWSPYWQSRLDDGDVTRSELEPESQQEALPVAPPAPKTRSSKSED
jgi:hypothetical protein